MAPKKDDPKTSTQDDTFDPDEYIDYLNKKKEGGAASSRSSGIGRNNIVLLVLLVIIAVCAIIICAELGSVISFTSQSAQPATVIIHNGDGSIVGPTGTSPSMATADENVPTELPPSLNTGENVCAGKNPKLENEACVVDAIVNVGPQSGANVTKGYQGQLVVDHQPILTPYWQNGMCPVNVHWHEGTEHYSVGQYDETGVGPSPIDETTDGTVTDMQAFQCKLYDPEDPKFTKPYTWKHCYGMEVGQTYEVHWPHSAAGACGTPNQYQTPFYDGVFCRDNVLTDTATQVGVQAQVFTIVNDEAYFYPDLMRGMIVDGSYGQDIAKYTGSTTGSARSNRVCSAYSPITWQVDRVCHLISASSFDKMCADMKMQRDDMSDDLHPHGARALVADELSANNHNRRGRRALRRSN